MARVVIDANVAVALAVNLPYSELVQRRITSWREREIEIVVPGLWQYEVVSALRKAIVAGWLAPSDGIAALEDLFRLGVREVEASLETHRLALSWAARLKQTVAYDAQYLALAEQIGAEFWTADRPLVNNARQTGAAWVRWIGEEEA